MRSKGKQVFIMLIMISLCSAEIYSQMRDADFRIHNRGNLWETMKDDGTIGAPDPNNRFEYFPTMDWPGGPTLMSKDDQRSYSVGSGIWIGGIRSDGSTFLVENGPFQLVDNGEFEELAVNENFIESENYNPHEAEQEIIAEWKNSESITVKRTSKAWSFYGLNNFIISEYEVTNNSGAGISDLFVGFPNLIRPSYQDFVVHNGWGDDFNRADEYVRYDEINKILYSYDHTPSFSLPNDVGNYWDFNQINEMRTPGYAGISILGADEAKDGREQPSTVFYCQLLNNTQYLTTVSSSAEDIYAILSGEDKSLQASEEDLLTPFMLLGVGPYDINSGESIKIAVVEAVNGLPIGETIKGLDVQPDLPAGLDSLRNSIANAKVLYNNSYQLSSVPPPSPNVELIPVPESQLISILWDPVDEGWVDPISGITEIKEFRIYQSDRAFTGPYELIKKIRPGRDSDRARFFDTDLNKWVYEDNSVALGAGYYYSVTSLDTEGDESWFTNRNEEAMFASKSPAKDAMNVNVFPNPFKLLSGFPTTGAENSIVWANLPSRCTIRIFTSNGELVRTMEHDSQASGEEIWDQLSDARQRIAPGIYFWTVTSDVGNAKGSLLIIK